MNELKEHKTLIIVCISLIGLALLFVWFVGSRSLGPEIDFDLKEGFLRNYEVNEVIPVTVDDEQMARTYLVEYVSLMINDPEKAYELLDEEYKEKRYPTYESFKSYRDLIINNRFVSATLDRYDIKVYGGYKVFDVIDAAGNNFLFKQSSIMNYKVLLDNYTI